jgi:predicted GH43/DUF377 family glycosyl hydrolase
VTEVNVVRSPVTLFPDQTRQLVRTYLPHEPAPSPGEPNRVQRILERVLSLTQDERLRTLEEVYSRFGNRVSDLDATLLEGFSTVEPWISEPGDLDVDDRRLIGSYFLHEYTVEGAALTNPSIVAHPDQSGLPSGAIRVVVSLRAVGEGHISSIEFRTGQIDASGAVDIEAPGPLIYGSRETPLFDKRVFRGKLAELGADAELHNVVLGPLSEKFTMEDLDSILSAHGSGQSSTRPAQQVIHMIHWLASSNYRVTFAADSNISQRILMPNGPSESNGMEDARFVRFTDTDGTTTYYATYTAFDGFNILPQLIETADFRTFRVATLNGTSAVNKGLALFPRRVGGQYMAIGRSDGESNFLMWTDHVRFWNHSQRIQMPARPWETVQIGNAGAPIETEAGWLLITHGVGPMRQYALGAVLLDIDEPSRMLGHLSQPLLMPEEDERDGYVPNVVYSCGSLLHDGNVVIAYGASDRFTRFATVSLDALLGALTAS